MVAEGMFPNELFVLVAASGAYVDARKVRLSQERPRGNEQVRGQVLAFLISEEQDEALIELPGEPVVGGLRTWISKQELTAA
jgi:hypothetical protein